MHYISLRMVPSLPSELLGSLFHKLALSAFSDRFWHHLVSLNPSRVRCARDLLRDMTVKDKGEEAGKDREDPQTTVQV